MSRAAMVVAGVMSGTSADGINVALLRIGERHRNSSKSSILRSSIRGQECPRHMITLLGHADYCYPSKGRPVVLSAMNAESARMSENSRLNFLLGELYADAVMATQRQFR